MSSVYSTTGGLTNSLFSATNGLGSLLDPSEVLTLTASIQGVASALGQMSTALQNFSSSLQSDLSQFSQMEIHAITFAANAAATTSQMVVQPVYTLGNAPSLQALQSAIQQLQQVAASFVLQ